MQFLQIFKKKQSESTFYKIVDLILFQSTDFVKLATKHQLRLNFKNQKCPLCFDSII